MYGATEMIRLGVSIHWTGLLDWNTGLSYIPFLGKFLCLFTTFLQSASSWILWMILI